MGNFVRRVRSQRAYTILREHITDTVDENSFHWPRVDASLRYLTRRIQTMDSIEKLKKSLEEKGGECIVIHRLPSSKPEKDDGYTHVLSTRVFRFAWLDGPGQLQSVQMCPHGFDAATTNDFCINPFHYEIDRSRLITIAVQKNRFVWPAEGLGVLKSDDSPVPNYVLDSNSSIVRRRNDQEKLVVDNTAHKKHVTIEPDEGKRNDKAELIYVQFAETLPWMKFNYFEGSSGGSMTTVDNAQYDIEADTTKESTPDRLVVSLAAENHKGISDRERARRRIGRGIEMHYVDGYIFLENRSLRPVFIQCSLANNLLEKESTAVMKVHSRCVLKLWNNVEFAKELARESFNGFKDVTRLHKLTSIRIAFARGWGQNYGYKRVTEVGACWLTIRLPSIADFIEKTLDAMGRPPHASTSLS